jgi:HEPN domain-containing protein
MNSHSAQAQALFDAALRDRLTLRLLRDSGQAPEEVMGFHAQQACEKLIKAVLVMHGVVFERTHDLAALAALCGDLEKLPSGQFFKTRSENAISASLHFQSLRRLKMAGHPGPARAS